MIAVRGYDKLAVNHGLVLSLPFEEATGVITRDVATPHHEDIDLVGVPAWVSLANGLGMLDFNAAAVSHYLDCPAVDTADLDFTTQDYSIVSWIYPEFSAASKMIIARYELDASGWELYLYDSAPRYLQLRHHHASFCPDPGGCPPGNTRTGCYSSGWVNNTWHFLGLTRHGGDVQMYRDGKALEVTYGVGGIHDPDACNRDLVIGCRFTKDADWYNGKMWNPRIWKDKELSAYEMNFLFNCERHWFGK